jgi:hypothetical protein
VRSEVQEAPRRAPQRDARGRLLPGNSGNPVGWAITRIKQAERAAARKALAAELEADLGHPPTVREKVLIESLAAATIEARVLRGQHKSSIEQDRLVARCCRALGLEAEAPAVVPLRERMARGAP